MAGSTVANTIGNKQAEKALAGAQNAERVRQKQFDDQSFALNTASQNRFADMPAQMDTKATDLAEMFNAPAEEQPVDPVLAMPESSSNIVTSRENAAKAKAKGETDQRATDLGKLRSFGDILGGASRMQGRDAAELGLIGSMRRGSQAVLPLELQAAQDKGRGMRMFGDILSMGGAMVGPGGFFGGGGGGLFGPGAASSIRPMPNPRLI